MNDYLQFDIFKASQKKLAFDLETEEFSGFGDLTPVGITCAATLTDDGELLRWYGREKTGAYDPKMSTAEAAALVDYLWDKQEQGYQITTWNGLSFDFQILYGQSGQDARCKQIAMSHVDMMFHFFCIKGFAVSLNKTAAGMGILGKPEGMDGSLAPGMWLAGQFTEVLGYVEQDVNITMQIARACDQEKSVRWISKRGVPNNCPLPNGWLTVEEALNLPKPDVSWMNDPWERTRFTRWI